MHEVVAHAFVDRYVGLPPDGEGGALNEAFAYALAAMALGSPRLGASAYLAAPQLRALENEVSFPEAQDTKTIYRKSLAVSGVLWGLRDRLGAEVAEAVTWSDLLRIGPAAKLADFPNALIAALEIEDF